VARDVIVELQVRDVVDLEKKWIESFGLDLGSYSSLLNDNCWICQRDLHLQSYNDKEVCVLWCQNPKLCGAKSHQLFAPNPRQRKPCPSPLVVQ
jgi:hypothetical protein